MGACLSSSQLEVGGAHVVDCRDCTPSSDARSSSRKKGKWGRRARKKKPKKEKKRAGGLFDRRGSGAADPAVLLARVEAGGSLTEEEILRLPGRMCLSGSSDSGCIFTQQGRKGTNQDAMIVWENFASRDDTIFCGVFDGHGPFGHMVARKVRDSLPIKVHTQWKNNSNGENSLQHCDVAFGSTNSEETASIGKDEWSEPIDSEDKLPEIYQILKPSLLKAFKLMDKELKLHPAIDCFCSGTTAVVLVKQGQDLVIGNVGDSRAVLGSRDKDNSLLAVQLTVDLKPNLPREAARIQQCKGRVFALQDEPEVARVWLPNNDSPGLAMARAFGDFCLKDYGLISVPDISYRHLTERDEFIILATDGIWDVLSNKEAVDVVASAPTRSTAARALVEAAVRSWRLKFPTSKVDDCAVVCLFLDLECSSDFSQDLQDVRSEKSCDEVIKLNAVDAEKDLEESLSTIQQDGSATTRPDSLEDVDNLEILPASEPREGKMQRGCQSTRSLADCMSATEEEEWSALEGVTRVNSLVNLPRFLSSDKKSTTLKKRL